MDPLSIEQITHFAGAVRQNIPAERIVTHLSTRLQDGAAG